MERTGDPNVQRATVHFFASFFRVASGSIFAMLDFVGQRPGLNPGFFASSFSTLVSMSLNQGALFRWLHGDR